MNFITKTLRFCSYPVTALILAGNAHAQVELLTNRDFSGGLTNWTLAPSTSGSAAGTCSYNADAAPGTETLTGVAGFTPLTGTQIALGSMSLTGIGRRSCVLYQDVAIPAGATTATFAGDLGIKSVNGLAPGDQAIFIGMYSTADVPNLNVSTALAGTARLVVGGASTSPNLATFTSATWNVSTLAGTTVRLAIINGMQSTVGGTGAFVPGANSVIGGNNLSFRVVVPVAPATVANIPTLSQWGLIILSAMLALLGIAFKHRRSPKLR
ncbi:MAG: IPTL-CTERM sorting domain-containing protein [Acidovorax sp.]|uniref:IPTL-CTERM sorting domain-containing protein n=1 Tax=Acidovorax sp. TaxID=1872122 RepID=UPI00391A6E60